MYLVKLVEEQGRSCARLARPTWFLRQFFGMESAGRCCFGVDGDGGEAFGDNTLGMEGIGLRSGRPLGTIQDMVWCREGGRRRNEYIRASCWLHGGQMTAIGCINRCPAIAVMKPAKIFACVALAV